MRFDLAKSIAVLDEFSEARAASLDRLRAFDLTESDLDRTASTRRSAPSPPASDCPPGRSTTSIT